MSIKVTVESENKFLIVRYSGAIDYNQLCEDILTLIQMPEYDKDWDGISDFLNAEILYTKEEMYQFQKFVSGLSNASTGRWAVVMPDIKSYKTTVIWDILSENIHDDMFVCHYESEAREWLINRT